ncbi:hypothetical protein, partial [Paraburkholderia mimosarum]|uniref:hypothetical protein n=1 Tax=Paraburkholderia mimosarum TaxID=312026 RepID=UPI001EE1DE97
DVAVGITASHAHKDMTILKQFEPPVGHRRSAQKNGAYRLGKFELRLCPLPLAPQGGFFTPPMRWLDYAAPELASLRRPSGGPITPPPDWLYNAAR